MNTSDKYFSIVLSENLKHCFKVDEIRIELTPHMVNPDDNTISENRGLNTKLQWWVEVLGYTYEADENGCHSSHLWELDCGGDSAEDAVGKLYELCFEYVELL